MKKLFIIAIAVAIVTGCAGMQIPWEDRWANDYCNTIDWSAQSVDPTSGSILCNLAEKHQITLREAQGIVFWLAALGTIVDQDVATKIGEYTMKAETYLQTPSLTLAGFFGMITSDSQDPRYAMLGNLINYSVFTVWGNDPLADYILQPKDMWFLRAHLQNVRNMVGYTPPAARDL